MPISIPTLEELSSADRKVSSDAWSAAYPLLWEAGLRIALVRLSGQDHEMDREDVVSTAMTQIVKGVIEKTSDSYNQMQTFDDVLNMMRHIVRQRINDFHRARGRRPEDAFEEIPEIVDLAPDLRRFQWTELLEELNRLPPPLPEVFRDRFVEGWSTDEIAQRRNVNRNTLLGWFSRGFGFLRERLTQLEVIK